MTTVPSGAGEAVAARLEDLPEVAAVRGHGLWIGVDLASLPLYVAKQLWVTAALYAAYLGLALWGLVQWHGARRRTGAGAGA